MCGTHSILLTDHQADSTAHRDAVHDCHRELGIVSNSAVQSKFTSKESLTVSIVLSVPFSQSVSQSKRGNFRPPNRNRLFDTVVQRPDITASTQSPITDGSEDDKLTAFLPLVVGRRQQIDDGCVS